MGELSFRTGLLIGGLAVTVIGLALALILTSGGGGGEESDTTTEAATANTTTAPTTESTTTTTTPPQAYYAFVTPSGNIVCRITNEDATCGVKEFTYVPPLQPASCELSGWGHSLGVGTSGPGGFVCRGDPPASFSSPVLPYGQRHTLGSFNCLSSEDGVRCVNRKNGRGFAVSRERFATR